jgi:hypothetical protein
MRAKLLAAAAALLVVASNAHASTLSVAGGGWSWFGDPRAIAIAGDVYIGWITSAGNVDVGRISTRPFRATTTPTRRSRRFPTAASWRSIRRTPDASPRTRRCGSGWV